ncbi:MAG TPA: urea transporter [Sphingomonadaceae bacterium]|nr:urea transporter [Sphingomonadaceae bacterium]
MLPGPPRGRVGALGGVLLRGSGQVIFMNSPLSGACNIAALAWGAHSGGTTWAVALGAVVGVLVATLAAALLRADEDALRQGLHGFNGLLVGAAIPTFLADTPAMWAMLILATAASAVVTLATERALRPVAMPGLTFPFVLTAWLVLLAAQDGSGFSGLALAPAGELAAGPDSALALIARAWLTNVSQVFFIDDPVSGALILTGLALHSRWCAALAAAGSAIGVAAALAAQADPVLLAHGLLGYSAVLTAPAVGCIFMAPSARTLGYALLAALFTMIVQGAVASFVQMAGLPPFTFPFVLATWLFLLAWRSHPRDGAETAPSGEGASGR